MRMVVFAIVMAAALSAGGCELIVGPSLLAANVGTGVEGLTAPKLTRRIHVVDAETNQPVAGATVTATHSLDLMGDWVASGQTDERGEVTLHIANRRLHALSFSITAPGYLWRQEVSPDAADGGGPGPLSQADTTYYLYKEPGPTRGLRVPAGFRGLVVYTFGPERPDFQYPPGFPPGRRVWWVDLVPDGVTVVEQPPNLGNSATNTAPWLIVETGDGQRIPTPEPSTDVPGVALWFIGVRTPGGPDSQEFYRVAFVGDKAAALAAADAEDRRHPGGRTGHVDVYWLRRLGRWPPRRP